MTSKTHCFAHSHMTMRAYGLWTRVRELYAGVIKKHPNQKFIFFDGADLARGFHKTPVSTLYEDCATLVKEGWFEVQGNPQARKKNGSYEARRITPLSHKEWVSKYPSKCTQSQESHSISQNGQESVSHSIRQNDHSISQNHHSTLMEKDLGLEAGHDSKNRKPYPLPSEILKVGEDRDSNTAIPIRPLGRPAVARRTRSFSQFEKEISEATDPVLKAALQEEFRPVQAEAFEEAKRLSKKVGAYD
jgi:hypothetical protein